MYDSIASVVRWEPAIEAVVAVAALWAAVLIARRGAKWLTGIIMDDFRK